MDQNPRRLWLIIAAVCLVTAVLDGFQAYMQARIAGEAVSWRAVIWQASEWMILGALTPITYHLGRRFPLRRPHLARNVLVHLGGALALCVAWAGAGVALRLILGTSWQGVPLSQHLASWMLISLPWSVFIYFAVLGCMHAFAYFAEARERETQAAQLAGQLAEARLGALRMQLHPHFLFNSLNAIPLLAPASPPTVSFAPPNRRGPRVLRPAASHLSRGCRRRRCVLERQVSGRAAGLGRREDVHAEAVFGRGLLQELEVRRRVVVAGWAEAASVVEQIGHLERVRRAGWRRRASAAHGIDDELGPGALVLPGG